MQKMENKVPKKEQQKKRQIMFLVVSSGSEAGFELPASKLVKINWAPILCTFGQFDFIFVNSAGTSQ